MSEARKLFYIKMGEEDKRLHINYSAVILLLSAFMLPLSLALIFTFLVGLGKEVWDHFYGSGFCLYDMAANVIGMGFVIPLLLALDSFF